MVDWKHTQTQKALALGGWLPIVYSTSYSISVALQAQRTKITNYVSFAETLDIYLQYLRQETIGHRRCFVHFLTRYLTCNLR